MPYATSWCEGASRCPLRPTALQPRCSIAPCCCRRPSTGWSPTRAEPTWMPPSGVAATRGRCWRAWSRRGVSWRSTATRRPSRRAGNSPAPSLACTWCTPPSPTGARCWTSWASPRSRACCWTSAFPRPSWTRPSGASASAAMRRWTCAWTRRAASRRRNSWARPTSMKSLGCCGTMGTNGLLSRLQRRLWLAANGASPSPVPASLPPSLRKRCAAGSRARTRPPAPFRLFGFTSMPNSPNSRRRLRR